jgi:hypothetical protein
MAEKRLRVAYGVIRPANVTTRLDDLPEAVARARPVTRWSHDYRFGNVNDNGTIRTLTGRLGYPAVHEAVENDFDARSDAFIQREAQHADAVSSPFVLDYENGFVAFEDLGGDMKPNGFVSHLRALLNTADDAWRFNVELVTQEESFRAFLGRVTRVTEVTFEVRPTNPGPDPIFEPLDRPIRGAKAQRARVTLENENGLDVDPPEDPSQPSDNLADQGLVMVEKGYGVGRKLKLRAEDEEGRSVEYDGRESVVPLKDVYDQVADDHVTRAQFIGTVLLGRLEWLRSRAPR